MADPGVSKGGASRTINIENSTEVVLLIDSESRFDVCSGSPSDSHIVRSSPVSPQSSCLSRSESVFLSSALPPQLVLLREERNRKNHAKFYCQHNGLYKQLFTRRLPLDEKGFNRMNHPLS